VSRVTDRRQEAITEITHAVTDALDAAILESVIFLKSRTPTRTGTARRSQHGVVMDAAGNVLRSPGSDENGNALPSYPGTGKLTGIVGSNCGYYRWVDQGARGRTGTGALAQTLTELEQRWAEQKRKLGLR